MNSTAVACQLEIAVNRCNDGVVQLTMRNYERAVENFSLSLQVAKQVLNQREEDDEMMDDGDERAYGEVSVKSSLLDRCMVASSAVEHQQRYVLVNVHDDTQDASSFICHQAIPFLSLPRLMQEDIFSSNISQEDAQHAIAVVLSTIVVFNMALAFQLSANGSGKRLRKSLRLYDLAYNLQRTEQLVGCGLFTMATLNNLGLIHKQLRNNEACQLCFNRLLSATMFVVAYHNNSEDTDQEGRCSSTPFHNLETFLSNTTRVCFQRKTAPAA